MAVLLLPVVLLLSATLPRAVLLFPMLLLPSAPAPLAVFRFSDSIVGKGAKTVCRVVDARAII